MRDFLVLTLCPVGYIFGTFKKRIEIPSRGLHLDTIKVNITYEHVHICTIHQISNQINKRITL